MDDQTREVPTQPVTPQPPVDTTPPPPLASSPKVPKVRLPNNVKVTLVIFLLSSAFILSLVPHLGNRTLATPPYWILLLGGFLMILVTALLFMVLGTLHLGFGRTALIMAFGYNSVIALIKFVISPQALYVANHNNPFNTQTGDPNSLAYYMIVGVIILFLYIGVFKLLYNYFHKRVAARMGGQIKHKSVGDAIKHPGQKTKGILIFSLGAIGMIAFGGFIIIIPLIFAFVYASASLTYLGYVFGTLGLPLLMAIALGIYLAYQAFEAVEKQVLVTGNTTLLASFLWLGLSLIILYHILWIVFMLTLVHIWPFNTYSPK